jgi:hypothetical protein
MDYQTAQEVFDALSAPFPSEMIDWRVGSTNSDKTKGLALAYIDARTAMDRFDTVCGPDGWQCNYTPAANMLICNIGVNMPGAGWVWKSDGAGATDVEGEKGMASDAFKRASVRFGIARYLYDLDSPWVAIEPIGKSFRIVKTERDKLNEVHDKAAQKAGWGNPTDVATYRVLLAVVNDTVTQPSDVIEFREKYKSMMPMLRVAQRRHLETVLDRVGTHSEAAE